MENKLLSLSRMLALLTLSSNGQWRCLQCTSNLNDAHETRQLIAVLIGKSISNTRWLQILKTFWKIAFFRPWKFHGKHTGSRKFCNL